MFKSYVVTKYQALTVLDLFQFLVPVETVTLENEKGIFVRKSDCPFDLVKLFFQIMLKTNESSTLSSKTILQICKKKSQFFSLQFPAQLFSFHSTLIELYS